MGLGGILNARCLNGRVNNWITNMKKIPDALVKRYEESDRLLAAFKITREEWFKTTLASCPASAIKVLRYVREMPRNAEDDFLLRMQNLGWLMGGSQDVKIMMLRVIEKRLENVAVLNDPIPPQTNMYFKAKQILQVR